MLIQRLEAVVFLHHGIGDLVMAIPLLSVLLKKCSDPSKVLVFVKCNSTRRVLEITGFSRHFKIKIFNRRLAIFYPISLSLRRPRWFIAPQSCGDWRMPLFSLLTMSDNSVGPATKMRWPNFNKTIPDHDELNLHKVDYYLRILELAGYSSKDCDVFQSVQLQEEVLMEGRKFINQISSSAKRWYAFTPGSTHREKHKRWPAEHYGSLAAKLLVNDPESHVLVIGSKDEQGLLDMVRNCGKNTDRIHVVTPSDIGLAAAIIKCCACVITGCNGPSHLAGLVGTPLVSIFGPTNPGNTGAWAKKRRVLVANLTCSPCYRLGFLSGCSSPICMQMVTPDDVYSKVIDLMSTGGCDPLPWLSDQGAVGPSQIDYLNLIGG